MSEALPTFHLPPCPACSARGFVIRPVWKFASNSSAKQGRKCYFFVGCKHAEETANPRVVYFEPSDWAGVERDWARRCEKLFAQRTANWTSVQRAKFLRDLEGKAFLPGATEAMDFSTTAL